MARLESSPSVTRIPLVSLLRIKKGSGMLEPSLSVTKFPLVSLLRIEKESGMHREGEEEAERLQD